MKLLKSAYGLENDATRVLIGSKLKGEDLTWFHSKPEYIETTTDQLLNEMRKMFYQRPNKILLKKEFEDRTNRVPIADEERIYYYIEGISDFTLRNQSRIQRFGSVEALLAAFEKVTLNLWFQTSKNEKTPKNTFKESKDVSKANTKENRSKNRSYNCRKWGHLSSQCDQKARKKEPASNAAL